MGFAGSGSTRKALVWLAAILTLAMPHTAIAQGLNMPDLPDTAGNRAQPDYDPAGISLGSIVVRPSISATSSWDSNVFARESGAVSDSVASLAFAASAASDKPGRTWSLRSEARIRRYARLHGQNDEQYSAHGQFGWEFGAATRVSGDVDFSRSSVSRGTFENGLQVGSPLRQSRLVTNLRGVHRFNRLSIDLGASYQLSRFDDVALDDGSRIDQSFRNGERLGGLVGLSYEVRPQFTLQVQGTVDRFSYEDNSPTNRDAKAYAVTLGGRYEVTRLFYIQLGAGLRRHAFDNASYPDISGVALTGRARWYPTPLVSLNLDLTQSTTTSTFDAVSAVTATRASLGADYEIRRNIVASADLAVTQEDYGQLNGSARRYELTGQAVWKLNRWLRLSGRANYERRTRSVEGLVPRFQTLRFFLTASIAR